MSTSHDDGGDAVSPRTLAQVVERFAHLTSDEADASPSLPQNQYADVFKETGPDGAGALGPNLLCILSHIAQAHAQEIYLSINPGKKIF